MTVLDAELQPRTIRLRRPPGAGDGPVGRLLARRRRHRRPRRTGRGAPGDRVHGDPAHAAPQRVPSGRRHGEAFGRWLEFVLGEFGLVVYDASDPAAKPLVGERLRPRGRSSGTHGASWPPRPATGWWRAATTRRSRAHADGVALFSLDGGRTPIRFAQAALPGRRRRSSRRRARWPAGRRRPRRSARTSCCARSCRTRCSRRSATSPARTSSPISASCKPVYAHFGVPMPLMYRARRRRCSIRRVRFLSKYDCALEALQRAGRERRSTSCSKRSCRRPSNRRSRRRSTAIDERMQRWSSGGAGDRSDARRRGASTLGRMQHELQTLHSKMIQAAKRRDETLRRQFTAHAGPGLPARPRRRNGRSASCRS